MSATSSTVLGKEQYKKLASLKKYFKPKLTETYVATSFLSRLYV